MLQRTRPLARGIEPGVERSNGHVEGAGGAGAAGELPTQLAAIQAQLRLIHQERVLLRQTVAAQAAQVQQLAARLEALAAAPPVVEMLLEATRDQLLRRDEAIQAALYDLQDRL